MLQLAAGIFVNKTRDDAGRLQAAVKVKNVACGHGLPTGEPLRHIVLLVEATCDGRAVAPVGGHVVPDFGGARERRTSAEDWARWPGAQVDDVVRVIRRGGGWHDYEGFGRFARGEFEAREKGMPVETWVGEARVVAVDGDQVTYDGPLPDGDVAYLIRPNDHNPGYAGAPGFGFARVTVGADGRRMVPHFAAVDVASDNRLLPQKSWTSTHVFEGGCDTPRVRARLIYRAYPMDLARARGWSMDDVLMTEVTR